MPFRQFEQNFIDAARAMHRRFYGTFSHIHGSGLVGGWPIAQMIAIEAILGGLNAQRRDRLVLMQNLETHEHKILAEKPLEQCGGFAERVALQRIANRGFL